jgi:hypothetical protein
VFATADELATHLQTSLTSDQVDAAEQALRIATQAVRTWTGQQITAGESTVELYPQSGVVLLPELPVGEVTEVTADGEPVEWWLKGAKHGVLLVGRLGVYVVEAGERWWPPKVTVTYSHGYEDVPDDVKGVVLEVASRTLDNPSGYVQKTVGDVNVSYGSHSGLATGFQLSASQMLTLQPYRRVA